MNSLVSMSTNMLTTTHSRLLSNTLACPDNVWFEYVSPPYCLFCSSSLTNVQPTKLPQPPPA
jgi:hypothetical protein